MEIFASLLVTFIGAIAYIAVTNPKIAELGRLSFVCGLLVTLLNVGKQAVTLFGG